MADKVSALVLLLVAGACCAAKKIQKENKYFSHSHGGDPNAPACPLVGGCTSLQECHAGQYGPECSLRRPADLSACHWPPVPAMGSDCHCSRVGSTPDCSCAPSDNSSTTSLPVCQMVMGCTPTSAAMCGVGPYHDQCDVSNPANVEPCHWPVAASGMCISAPGVEDCLCAPSHENHHPLPACPVVQGCTATSIANCDVTVNHCYAMQPTDTQECHWPAAAAGICQALPGVPDCYCEPAPQDGHVPDCPIIWGCAPWAMHSCTAGPAGTQCDESETIDIVACHWPPSASATCNRVGFLEDCACEPTEIRPANLPECPIVNGCSATSSAYCHIFRNGYYCNTADPPTAGSCHWPPPENQNCLAAPGIPSCICEPFRG